MLVVLIVVLSVTLLWALVRQWRYTSALRRLQKAIFTKQPLLREDDPGALGQSWDEVCDRTNELIDEVNHLQQLRSGQLAQFEATLGSLREAVLIVDGNNYILLANQALREIFPQAVNILGQRLETVLHSAAFLSHVEAVRRGLSPPQQEIEFVEGSATVWVEVAGTVIPPLDPARGACALFVLHDVTRQKRLELVRKEFVANVSHELRTPLSVIKGYVETLVDGSEGIAPEDRRRFLLTIQRHTERLNSILEDLLQLSRLESVTPGLKREPTDVAALVRGVIDDYRPRAEQTGHPLTLEEEGGAELEREVSADPLRVTQVLGNLLDNALKHTPRGARIAVSVRALPDAIQVSVRDTGPGIPEADIPHVFERFYRVDKGRSRDTGGTGLGLSIVKHIVQLHGGRVWVESTVGSGSVFHFTLPRRGEGSGGGSGSGAAR
jgi:two-component system phosphate regulon sensor histidine kinase PhoR